MIIVMFMAFCLLLNYIISIHGEEHGYFGVIRKWLSGVIFTLWRMLDRLGTLLGQTAREIAALSEQARHTLNTNPNHTTQDGITPVNNTTTGNDQEASPLPYPVCAFSIHR